MSLLNRVKRSTTAVVEEKDSLGGRKVFDTNVYPFEIKEAFIFTNDNGSTGVKISGKFESGESYENTLWIADRKGNNFYVDKKSKQEKLLPAYIQFNTMCELLVGFGLDDTENELETTEKVVKMGDKNQTVEVVDAFVGETILIALEKQKRNKSVKVGEGRNAKYVPSNEIVFENELVKIFSADKDSYGYTLNEMLAEAPEPEFMNKWLEKNQGKEIDRYKPVAEDAASTAPAKTGLAARRPVSKAAPVADEVEEESDEEQEEQEEAPKAAPARRTFTRK
jgi:hypothetical protein